MFFIALRSYWQIILIVSALQLTTLLCWGWISQIIIKQKYGLTTSYYQLFKRGDYNPQSTYDLLQYPQYSLVIVKFNSNRTIKSETFYTKLLGDRVYFEYENDRQSKSEILMGSV